MATVLVKRRNLNTDIGAYRRTHQKTATVKSGTEAFEETRLLSSLSLGFQPPESRGNKFLFLKPLSLLYYLKSTPANQHSTVRGVLQNLWGVISNLNHSLIGSREHVKRGIVN